MPEVGKPIDLLSDCAAEIEMLFQTAFHPGDNARMWFATYQITDYLPSGHLVVRPICARIFQRNDDVPNEPKFQASITPRFGDAHNTFQHYADSGAHPIDLAAFLRLDQLAGEKPKWQLDTTLRHGTNGKSGLSVVRGSLTDRRMH